MPICSNCSNPVGATDKSCQYCDAPIEVAYSPAVEHGGMGSAASSQTSAVVNRYKDAYLTARAVDGVGSISKGIGVAIALLLGLAGLVTIGNGRGGDTGAAIGIMTIGFGIATGAGLYVLGILVSAQGQILKAALDGAVNVSPFLTNEQRAKVMSLPSA